MVLVPIRDCKWRVEDSTYILKAGLDIEIDDKYLTKAIASQLFKEVKVEENVNPIKRKTATKSKKA